jgi:cyclophilin family peptidyl-prolyl cis-trans isomerase
MTSRCQLFACLYFFVQANLQAQPAVVSPLPPLVVGIGGTNVSIAEHFSGVPSGSAQGILVVSPYGPVVLDLLTEDAPLTVANFLSYVDDGSYRNVLVHRSVRNFVIQTGGFKLNATVDPLLTRPPVVNEFRISNTRGTVAMARMGGQTNSATSQWFVNLADNSQLDSVDGGFTVFARVRGNGMSVFDQIAALPTYSLTNIRSAFQEVPLRGITNGQSNLFLSNFVQFENVLRFPFSARSSDPSAWSASLSSNNVLSVTPGTNAAKSATITVEATDLEGRIAKSTFVVKGALARAYACLVGTQGRRVLVSLALSPSGAFSATTVEVSAGTLRLRGQLDRTGNRGSALQLADGDTVTLRYVPVSDMVTLTSGAGIFELRPVAWTGSSSGVSPLEGKLANTLFDLGKEGYAQLRFDKSGAAKVSGRLADGSKITASFRTVVGDQSDEPRLPFLAFWKAGPSASLSGTLILRTSLSAGAEAVRGTLQLGPRTLPAKDVAVVGSFWSPPPSGQKIDFRFKFESGPITGLPAVPVVWSLDTTGKTTLPDTSAVSSLKCAPATGLFTGKAGSVPFSGVLTSPLEIPFSGACGGGFAGPVAGSSARVEVLSP